MHCSGGSPLNDGLDGRLLHDMLCVGWCIEPTSCGCGGYFAWLKPRESGALEMVGCVCHNTITAVNEFKKAANAVGKGRLPVKEDNGDDK